ncbi:PH domain-containing protein [Phytoactinopolyspora alkaliphila]|uniref:PH domain-containing protein n=1 Tax=Phytoactinopolyspora alkaliphila TaxID=1783498 RepID=A0A6N9YMY8_9ACTN|nr:PH domain-containing protein [Phytoactinopolyspora alkaliphila]NED96344.1 PH domain-containing protein [Phytoactinopolyspora alkaliphila]
MNATPWRRLHSRMIWVDAVQSVVSLMPTGFAVWVVGMEPTLGNMWPVLAIAAFGVLGATADALRWVFTRYRVTEDYVERRTGVFVRRYRSVRRDRIRSVDTEAKLRHRLSGLRVVKIGAGQQSSAGESAFDLDAVHTDDAAALRRELLWGEAPSAPAPAVDAGPAALEPEEKQVLARLRPGWVVYNMFNIWAYLMALGLLWGAYWLGTAVGFDVGGFIEGLVDWEALGWGRSIVVGALVVGAVGAVGLGVNFFTENWNFELARVPGENGTLLRTRQGLFKTREVNRDDTRLRGIQISEPLLWRWMGMADTNVVTTGLDLWSMSQPTTILPRGPIGVARPVAAAVLGVHESPLEVPLARHPRAALRRRMWWATLTAVAVVVLLGWLAANDVVPFAMMWAGVALWPIAVAAAVVAYRALGHAVSGEYLVVRSGLMSRQTTALKRSAVSTVAVRQSLLQRRLGLKTVAAMSAAGWGAYHAPDVPADAAVALASEAAPGLLEPFLVPQTSGARERDMPSRV